MLSCIGVSLSRGYKTRPRCVEEGPEAALKDRPRPGKAPKLTEKQAWCIPEVSSDFVAAREDVLDLYEDPYDPKRPMVCFDESPRNSSPKYVNLFPPNLGRRFAMIPNTNVKALAI